MRLINVNTSRMERFLDYRAPPYVILSHTWGSDEEELTLRDVEEGNVSKRGVGSLKFQQCCEQAKNDGYSYAWIDTCCIDKTDLVELSEAINSMFRWYRDAAVCYAYLSDVHNDLAPWVAGSTFRVSRWFQRGWTLQELLAPRNVVFFTSGWEYMGTKASLRFIIQDITGIDRLFLRGIMGVHQASVAQRMSWASQRETKRREDMAYCLLGLFDIAMPLIYGEGGEQAFLRLQEQIISRTRDHSILAWGFQDKMLPTYFDREHWTSRGAFAASPSEFQNSKSIVRLNINNEPLETLEISAGNVRVSLSLIGSPSCPVALLNCAPGGDPKRVIGIVLMPTRSRDRNEYIRRPGCNSIKGVDVTNHIEGERRPINIRTDSRLQTLASGQVLCVYDTEDFAELCLEVVDVWPRSAWDREQPALVPKVLLTDARVEHPILVRIRHEKGGSRDFSLVLYFRQVGYTTTIRSYCVATCSRDTSLEDISGELSRVTERVSGRTDASNGLLNLRLTLEAIPATSMWVIRPEKAARPPAVTIDATVELQRMAESALEESQRRPLASRILSKLNPRNDGAAVGNAP